MKKIVFNCWLLRNRHLDGIGNFTVQVLKKMIEDHPEQQFDLLVDKKFVNEYFNYTNVVLHRIFPAFRHPILYVFFLEVWLPLFLLKIKPDLIVSMDGFLSLSSRTKQLPVIYDLNFEHYPENLPWRNRVYYRSFFPRFARKARHIVTISEYSKMDIVKTYNVDENKIDNVSCGISDYFFPCTEAEKIGIKQKYAGGSEYFFFVGTMHPRKNILRLIQAFDAFKTSNKNTLKLVLAGNIMWDDNSIKTVVENSFVKNDIVLAGRVNNEELRLLTGSSWCLVFVPIFEGFGLPPVEAMQCEVPVIASNITSIPEIVGDAALLVNPYNIEEIKDAMLAIYNNHSLRQALIQKGNIRKQQFTWANTAKAFWDSIQKCL